MGEISAHCPVASVFMGSSMNADLASVTVS